MRVVKMVVMVLFGALLGGLIGAVVPCVWDLILHGNFAPESAGGGFVMMVFSAFGVFFGSCVSLAWWTGQSQPNRD